MNEESRPARRPSQQQLASDDSGASGGTIPEELRELPRWVVWRWGEIDPKTGKPKKPPYSTADPTRYASSTNAETWATYEAACAVVERGDADGIGFALGPPYVGFDLDEELPEADKGAAMLVLDSYTEKSVSGNGYHVIVRGSLNGHGRHPQGIGVFQTGRFFYCTGDHVPGTPTTIEHRQAEIEEVLYRFLPPAPELDNVVTQWPVDLDDRDLIERALKASNGDNFERLWSGDIIGYPSHSDADLALCNHLAFWTNRDAARIDSLFRSSGLYRPKWERADYRERTIQTAVKGCSEGFRPSASPNGTHLGTHRVSQGAKGGVPASASQRPPIEGDALSGTHPPRFEFVTVEEFASIDEPSAEPLLGDGDETAVAAGSTVMTYGDGGAGKTTLTVDAAMHLAAGDDWLSLAVPNPVRVLLIENEGPRGKFRKKLDAKLTSWQGSPLGGRLRVLEEPWASVSLANEGHRAQLAAFVNAHAIEVLIVGPVVTLGMIGGGTPDEVTAFEEHVKKLRALLERPLVLWLIHHENKAGDVSGAWERVPDTLMHVQARGNGHTRLYWQKARWSSELHDTRVNLAWSDGETYTIEEREEVTEEAIAETILATVREHPGGSWNTIDAEVTGKGETKRAVRDRLIADGELVNASNKKRGFELWAADDPAAPETGEAP